MAGRPKDEEIPAEFLSQLARDYRRIAASLDGVAERLKDEEVASFLGRKGRVTEGLAATMTLIEKAQARLTPELETLANDD